jgi:hypothetical protein
VKLCDKNKGYYTKAHQEDTKILKTKLTANRRLQIGIAITSSINFFFAYDISNHQIISYDLFNV